MVPPPGTSRSLTTTWLENGFGFWLDDPAGSAFDCVAAVRQVLDVETRIPLPDRTDDVELISAAAVRAEQPKASMLRVPTSVVVNGLLDRPSGNWSPAMSWLARAVDVARDIVATQRVRPTLRPKGLRWVAYWNVHTDSEAQRALDHLVSFVPPVVIAASEEPARTQVAGAINALVDAVMRASLSEADWRPPLDRSRASGVVALRRVTSALSGPDAVFIGDSPAHEMAFAEWSTLLSEQTSLSDGGPAVRFQARLVPPDPTDATPIWFMGFETVDVAGFATPFSEIWDGTADAEQLGGEQAVGALRVRMRELIDRLTGQIAVFTPLVGEDEPSELALNPGEVALLLDAESASRRAGLSLVMPDGLSTPSARLTASATPMSMSSGPPRRGGLISVDWGVALGDIELSEEELQALADAKADIVALRGSWVQVDRRQLKNVLSDRDLHQREDGELTPAELLQKSISVLGGADDEHLSAEGWIATLLAGLPDDELTETVEPPGFNGELRPYQRRALGWLQFLGRLGLGGCLADDMGLGKTPTALAHLLERTLGRLHEDEAHQPHLVVCPVSVVHNWKSEAGRFTPELSVLIAHGPNRPQGEDLVEITQKHDIVITTYGTAPRIVEELQSIEWDVVVLDEAQTIKNHTTNAAKSMRTVQADQFLALTGTPVENRLSELWSILDTLNPGMLGGITWFKSTLATPIEDNADPEATATLRRITSPFILRRTKADRSLVPDLPDKIEQIAWATLTVEQAALYQAVVDDFTEQLAAATGMERRGLVLATLTKLKQVCNHPAHFLREEELGVGRSGKLERFDELITTILENNERALVFTQYRTMGELLSKHIETGYGVDAPFLHGGTTAPQRERMVQTFQSGDGPPIQLISLRAGGTGLNLTAASRVIHYDRWWNPAVEDQATDRSWRIGQDQTVFVHKLVCQGTLEERIDALLTEKRALAESVIGAGDQWLTELSTDELRSLVQLDASELSS